MTRVRRTRYRWHSEGGGAKGGGRTKARRERASESHCALVLLHVAPPTSLHELALLFLCDRCAENHGIHVQLVALDPVISLCQLATCHVYLKRLKANSFIH